MFELNFPILTACLVILVAAFTVRTRRILEKITTLAAFSVTSLVVLGIVIADYTGDISYLEWAHFPETLLPFVWYAAVVSMGNTLPLHIIRSAHGAFISVALLVTISSLLYGPVNFYYSPDFQKESVIFLTTSGFIFTCTLIIFLVISLVNLETILFSTTESELWRIKFHVVGVALIILSLLIYYSQALLFKAIDLQWIWLTVVAYLISSALMLVGSRRMSPDLHIHVSRHIAMKSVVLVGVGIYLLIFGLAGEAFRYLGIPFKKLIFSAAALLVGSLSLLVILSGAIRRRVKVYIHKNFYKQKYDYRIQWIEFSRKLSEAYGQDQLYGAVLRNYMDLFGFSSSALYMLDSDSRLYLPRKSLEFTEELEPLDAESSGIVQQLKEREWVLNAQDSPALDSSSRDFLSSHRIKLIVPLVLKGELHGFIILASPLNQEENYTYEDFDLMKTLARQAMVSFSNFTLAEQIIRMRESETIGNISTFVIHDLKNHISALSLLAENADEYIDNPEFQKEMLVSLKNTLSRMQQLISKLKNLGEKELLNLRRADLMGIVKKTIELFPHMQLRVMGGSVAAMVDADEVQKVLTNLILNAAEASPPEEEIIIETVAVPRPAIRVIDHGVGMSREFQSRELFKPFATTKQNGLGIGLFQCRRIVEAHGGSIEIQSEPGKGSVFTVSFPPPQA